MYPNDILEVYPHTSNYNVNNDTAVGSLHEYKAATFLGGETELIYVRIVRNTKCFLGPCCEREGELTHTGLHDRKSALTKLFQTSSIMYSGKPMSPECDVVTFLLLLPVLAVQRS